MNQVAIIKPKSVLIDMSDRFGMEPAAFEATVRATCLPPDKNGRVPTREEFAAFLLVAKEYRLNPITREIFAFMAKHGGIVPVVSVDGWLNLVNSHKECDGFSFDMEHDDAGKIVSCTCTMHRKDRAHPVIVTEYFTECVRPTDPWRSMPHRMIRHKSMIQAARYAFGFSGIYDEDEGRTIAEAVDVTPKAPLRVPSPNEIEQEVTPPTAVEDPITTGPQPKTDGPDLNKDYDGWVMWALKKITTAEDGGWLETFMSDVIDFNRGGIFPTDMDDLTDAYTKQQAKLNADE